MRQRAIGAGKGVKASGPAPRSRAKGALLDIYNFGDRLIATGDLDPVYNAIVGTIIERGQLARILIAYWCFYHLGVSAWMSQWEVDRDFWHFMERAADNSMWRRPCDMPTTPQFDPTPQFDRWPRGTERRHFRGAKSLASVQALAKTSPEAILDRLAEERMAGDVVTFLEGFPMFGPWIGFKAADMLERCAGVPIAFPDDWVLMYKEPAAALARLEKETSLSKLDVYGKLRRHFSKRPAPPSGDRACGVQEVETILCKWKSAKNGHYHIGKDIHEVRHGLKGWGDTAARMLKEMPKEVGEGLFA